MHINAMNALEIRFIEGTDPFFESRLKLHIDLLQGAPGCLGYAFSRSSHEPCLWLLSGHWASASEMTEHFAGPAMSALINFLIESGANLTFASFTTPQAEY
ncbi:putative quinol monooxygenase [Pseudomonas capsici]|uniref:putative quinol monooxygenase n=1 Tax=Pseudomonas capsici TaxID=2810614 RepID=UPI0021F16B3A|nr:antibiotic biosynthesis monooxygenase family protein [Pseudomonas capsici]MCV4340872.1 antibiotic biosynthesis monooxygenase [Pseudomonas capsici]